MRSPRIIVAALAGAALLSACSSSVAMEVNPAVGSSRATQVSATFSTGSGPAITYDQALVEAGARGAVSSTSQDGSTTVRLAVRGLEPERKYGAHAHNKPCGAKPEDAGAHFQYQVDPVQPSVDPKFANPQNEIWLDFITDESGAGSATSTVAWTFPVDRRARSVVIHAMPTATHPGHAGTAGARAACIAVQF